MCTNLSIPAITGAATKPQCRIAYACRAGSSAVRVAVAPWSRVVSIEIPPSPIRRIRDQSVTSRATGGSGNPLAQGLQRLQIFDEVGFFVLGEAEAQERIVVVHDIE